MFRVFVTATAAALLVAATAPVHAGTLQNSLMTNSLIGNALTSNSLIGNSITHNALGHNGQSAAGLGLAELNGVAVEDVVLPNQVAK